MSVLGVGPILRKVSAFSPEAQAVIDRMTGLTGNEQNAIATFVDAEVLNGNWDLIDDYFCFALTSEANSLTGFKLKTASKVGTVTHSSKGFETGDGTIDSYIESNYNPVSDFVAGVTHYAEGPPRDWANAFVGGFIFSKDNTGGTFVDNIGGTTAHKTLALDRTDRVRINYQINDTVSNTYNANNVLPLTAYHIATNGLDNDIYQNGISVLSTPRGGKLVNDHDIVFVRNNRGIMSSAVIGGSFFESNTFSFSGHYTHEQTLLTSLGVI